MNARLKSTVLSSHIKDWTFIILWRDVGRDFQAAGPANAKIRLPSFRRVPGCLQCWLSRVYRVWVVVQAECVGKFFIFTTHLAILQLIPILPSHFSKPSGKNMILNTSTKYTKQYRIRNKNQIWSISPVCRIWWGSPEQTLDILDNWQLTWASMEGFWYLTMIAERGEDGEETAAASKPINSHRLDCCKISKKNNKRWTYLHKIKSTNISYLTDIFMATSVHLKRVINIICISIVF